MRLVRTPEDLPAALERAGSEAAAAFNDGSVYIERAILEPRHIEIQVLGDAHGNVVYLGERECSIQRRHQKVVEECPASFDDAGLRQRMGEAAVAIARRAAYVGAGTVEFLVDAERNFYFLEMNTRLQVEHPVTEMVTGVDLVLAQLRVAAGEPLWFRQEDVQMRGAAIECRVYAEDPASNFVPSPGRITTLREPGGPGVRVDSGVYEGWEVAIHYDPLLAKLVVWAPTRATAIDRLRRALAEYRIGGIRTTLPLFRAIVDQPAFQTGAIDTGYLDRMLHGLTEVEPDRELEDLAVLAAVLQHASDAPRKAVSSNVSTSGWRRAARAATLRGAR
jgi:acetyl-CoA carboxylase biotin carboxylase subunit